MRLTRRVLAVALGAVLISTTLTPVAAQAGGPSILDCPTPSFVAVSQANSAGVNRSWNKIDSRSPGGTIVIHISELDWRYVSHGGDVKPGTRAEVQYYNENNELVIRHTTAPARSNGVIHHEPELRYLPYGPGTTLTVYAFWTDECDGNSRGIHLGYVYIDL